MVIVKDEHIPHRTWRLAKIEEFIYSKDGKIRSAKILFANKNVVTRAVSHLFPLEINSQFSCEKSGVKLDQASESGVKFNRTSTDLRNVSRRRKAAEEARRGISRQCYLYSVLFFPRSVTDLVKCHVIFLYNFANYFM